MTLSLKIWVSWREEECWGSKVIVVGFIISTSYSLSISIMSFADVWGGGSNVISYPSILTKILGAIIWIGST